MERVGKADCSWVGNLDVDPDVVPYNEWDRRIAEAAVELLADPEQNDELHVGLYNDDADDGNYAHGSDLDMWVMIVSDFGIRFTLREALAAFLWADWPSQSWGDVTAGRRRIAKVLRSIASDLERLALSDLERRATGGDT